jgi:hypothetical protein
MKKGRMKHSEIKFIPVHNFFPMDEHITFSNSLQKHFYIHAQWSLMIQFDVWELLFH